MNLKRSLYFFYQCGLIDIRNKKLVASSGDGHINKPDQLFLAPCFGFKKIEAEQEDYGIIEAFDAVDGGYCDAVSCDVVGFF